MHGPTKIKERFFFLFFVVEIVSDTSKIQKNKKATEPCLKKTKEEGLASCLSAYAVKYEINFSDRNS